MSRNKKIGRAEQRGSFKWLKKEKTGWILPVLVVTLVTLTTKPSHKRKLSGRYPIQTAKNK